MACCRVKNFYYTISSVKIRENLFRYMELLFSPLSNNKLKEKTNQSAALCTMHLSQYMATECLNFLHFLQNVQCQTIGTYYSLEFSYLDGAEVFFHTRRCGLFKKKKILINVISASYMF